MGDDGVKVDNERKDYNQKIEVYNAMSGHIRPDGIRINSVAPEKKPVEPKPEDTPHRRDVMEAFSGHVPAEKKVDLWNGKNPFEKKTEKKS